MKKFAIILSGCGSRDGSEIHETTMLLLSIKQLNCDYKCFSINKQQTKVINFITGKELNETRNILVESARIARGDIQTLDKLNVDDFDGIILPGGMGAASNLSTYSLNPNEYIVEKELEEILLKFKNQNKVICATCIAPVILAKVFKNIRITLGNDTFVKNIVEGLGNKFIETKSGDICVDKENKIITTPFYMLANNIKTIYEEAYKLVEQAILL